MTIMQLITASVDALCIVMARGKSHVTPVQNTSGAATDS